MTRLLLAAIAALTLSMSSTALAATDGGTATAADIAAKAAADSPASAIELPPPAPAEPSSVGEAVGTAAEAAREFRSREWIAGFFALVALLAFVLRRIADWKMRWFTASVWRTRALVFAVAFLTELLTAKAAGQSFSFGMFAVALGLALGASGVWHNRPLADRGDGIITGNLRG